MKGTVTHRDRKNPRSAEAYQKERHEKNAVRGKQVWVPNVVAQIQDETIVEGGHWDHIIVESLES